MGCLVFLFSPTRIVLIETMTTLSQNTSSLNKRYEELVNHHGERKHDTLYAKSLCKSLNVVLETLRGHF